MDNILSNTNITVYINLNNFTKDELEFVKNIDKEFVIRYKMKVQGHYVIKSYINYKTDCIEKYRKVWLPKCHGIRILDKYKIGYKDIRKNIEPCIIFNNNIVLYPNQKVICDEIESTMNKRITHNYVYVSKPGSGKTIMAMELMYRYKVKVLIILPNLFLLNQWKTEINKHLNLCDEDILIWTGENKKNNLKIYNENFKVILTTIHSSLKIDNNTLQDNNVNFTIYDEIHMYSTKEFSKTFWNTQTYYNIGLTGTPNKLDGFEKIFIQHINKINKFDSNTNNQFKGKVYIIENKAVYNNILTKSGTVSISLMINELCNDKCRNTLIVDNILKIYNDNVKNYIYIFSDRRQHLLNLVDIITNILRDEYIVIDNGDNNIKVLMGGSTEEDINNAVLKSRIIFTTYQYSSIGINIQKMNCLILATPRKNNQEQIIGRILRSGSDITVERIIVDIVDKKSIFYNQFNNRKKIYKLLEYSMIYS